MNHTRSQQDPLPGDKSVTDAVLIDLMERRQMGREKYGDELRSHNGRNALVDAYQEALDLTLYLKQQIIENERFQQSGQCNCGACACGDRLGADDAA